MTNYQHQVTGIYPDRQHTERTLSLLVEAGLPRDQFEVVEPHQPSAKRVSTAGSDGVLKDVLVDTAMGTAIGTGAGAVGAAAATGRGNSPIWPRTPANMAILS